MSMDRRFCVEYETCDINDWDPDALDDYRLRSQIQSLELVGINFYPDAEAKMIAAGGDAVYVIVSEPENEYDENAEAVYYFNRDEKVIIKVGHIARKQTAVVRKLRRCIEELHESWQQPANVVVAITCSVRGFARPRPLKSAFLNFHHASVIKASCFK